MKSAIVTFGIFLVSSLAAAAAPNDSAERNPRTAYFTTGDYQDLLWFPLDSQASIEAAFEALQKTYKVSRIWWRGGQDEIWGNQFVIRPENREFANIWKWWKYLAYEVVGTNRIAVKAAHDRGQEIWLTTGLFDNGSAADVGYVGFPYAVEDRARAEHPEWAPVNRFGTWRQGGPIEFAYPEARRALIETLTKYTVTGGYDGLAFLTYAENFSQRYEDEFGYSPPIVGEFQKRHGIDIRTQPFDKDVWSRLRGEYLTQFFRELRASLGKHQKQIAVCVDGHNPRLPTAWNFEGRPRTAGRIHFDLETWVKENLVDEINVYAPNTEKSIHDVEAVCKGTKTRLSVFQTRGPMPEGAPRIMFLATDIESGFDWENYVNYPDENIPLQPADALKNPDVLARRRLLTAVLKKKQSLTVRELAAAARDADLYVRRAAIKALAMFGDKSVIGVIESALVDQENSVRWQAALALADLSSTHVVESLLESAARDDSTFQFRFRALPEALKKLQAADKLGLPEKAVLAAQLTNANAEVREMVLHCFKVVGAPATPAIEAALLEIIRHDVSPNSRELALINMRSSFGATPTTLAAIRECMTGTDEAVQVRAASALAMLAARADAPREQREQGLVELAAFFRKYGDGCQRSDKDWGWREVGPGLLSFGDDGRAILNKMLADRDNMRLATLAWYVLYLPQGDKRGSITAEQDAEAHRNHPKIPIGLGRLGPED